MTIESSENWRAFEPNTTERDGRERNLDWYEGYLGFKREELGGLKILDLGTGETERFSRDVKDAGIPATVISLNPDYGPDDPETGSNTQRDRIKKTPGWQHKSVAAIAQELPFPDGSFDRVFGLFSVTVFAGPDGWRDEERARKWMLEIARVLKYGGEARLAPIIPHDLRRGYGGPIRALEDQGMQVDTEMITYGDVGQTQHIVMRPGGVKEIIETDPNLDIGSARMIIRK